MVRSAKAQTRLLSNEFDLVSSESDHGNDECDDDLPLTRIFTCTNQKSCGVLKKKENRRVLDSVEDCKVPEEDTEFGGLEQNVAFRNSEENGPFKVLDLNEEFRLTNGDSDFKDTDLNEGLGVSEEDSDFRVLEGNGDFRSSEDGDFRVSEKNGDFRVWEEEEDFMVSQEDENFTVLEDNGDFRVSEEKNNEDVGINAGFHGFKPGSMVWAKAFSHTWCPGWVLRRSHGKLLVAFFGSYRQKWLRESDILDFEENYAKLASRVRGDLVDVVDDALDELHRRVALGLMCSCQSPIEEIQERMERYETNQMTEVRKGFMAGEILGFVHKMAVSARVEDLEVVSATRLAAHVNAFRSFVSIKRDWMYHKTMRLSEINSISNGFEGSQQEKSPSSPSEDEITWPNIQETEVKSPKMEEENRHGLISEQVDGHVEVCMTNEMDFSVLFLDGVSESLHDEQVEEAEMGLGCNEQNPIIHSTLQQSGTKSKITRSFCSPHTVSDSARFHINDGFFLSEDVCCTQKETEDSRKNEFVDPIYMGTDHLSTVLEKTEIAQQLDEDNIPLINILTARVTLCSEKQKGVSVISDTNGSATRLENSVTEIECLDDDIPLNKILTVGVSLSSKKRECTYLTRDTHKSDTCLENPVAEIHPHPDDNIPLNKILKPRVSLSSRKQKDEPVFRETSTLDKSEAETEQKLSIESVEEPQVGSGIKTHLANGSKDWSFCVLLTHLHCLALDPFYSGHQSLKSVRRKFLKFRALIYKNVPNLVSKEYAFQCDGEASISKEQVNSGSEYLPGFNNVTTTLVQPNGQVQVANHRAEGVRYFSNFSNDTAKLRVYDTQDVEVVSISKINNKSNRVESISSSTLPTGNASISKEQVNSGSQSLPHFNNVITIANDREEEEVRSLSSFSDDYAKMKVCDTQDTVDVCTNKINDKSNTVSTLPTVNSGGKFHGKRKICQTAPDLSHKLHKTQFSASFAKLYASPLSIDGSNSTADVHQFPGTHQGLDVPTTLHMKFPKGFEIPSKEELEKKFIGFGALDKFKTRVFFFTGSGQVVFLHQHDAEVAYQYARRKNLFGQANVRYWLHQANPRKENGVPASFSTKDSNPVPSHKSCLKDPNLCGEMERRKPLRVKFIPGNQLSSLAATVVTGNRSFTSPDTPYNHCISEKPDISIKMLMMLEKCSQLVSTIKGSLGLGSYYSIFTCDLSYSPIVNADCKLI